MNKKRARPAATITTPNLWNCRGFWRKSKSCSSPPLLEQALAEAEGPVSSPACRLRPANRNHRPATRMFSPGDDPPVGWLRALPLAWMASRWRWLVCVFLFGHVLVADAQPVSSNRVLVLDGVDSYVQLPSGIFGALSQATVEGWV